MKYMHIAFHQIQKENKWRQQFLAELSVLHHYIKGMTINTYIMKSNIQNFRDKYIIYSWYVTKFPSVSASVYLNRNMTMNYYTPTFSMDFNRVCVCVSVFVVFFNVFCWSKRTWKRQMYKYLAQVWQYHNSLQFLTTYKTHKGVGARRGETAPHQQETDFTVA